MKTVIGLVLVVVSFLGSLFFRHYNGSMIPYPTVWGVSFIVLGLLGFWLVYISIRKVKNVVETHINSEIEKLKSSAEKIELNFDKCEFKSGSFSHEVEDKNISAVKFFAPGSLVSNIDTTSTENVIRSYLTYTDTIDGELCKFISQAFPFDQVTLKFYVLNNTISLYIDRFDRAKYLFDLKIN